MRGSGIGRHRALAGMGQRRIGRHARQPMKQRALARTLIADQSDFHGEGFRKRDAVGG